MTARSNTLACVTLACAALSGVLAACSAQADATAGLSSLVQDGSQGASSASEPSPPAEPAASGPAASEPSAPAEPAADGPAAAPLAGVEPGAASSEGRAPASTIHPREVAPLTAEQVGELAGLVAELRTSQGTLVLDFLPEKAPATVNNFVELARAGFYDGTLFHRVIPGLFAQGGDPTGTGDGGPGYFIRAEFNDEPHVRGTVSMARLRHPDSAGSQFFICLAPQPYLDGGYTAFGRVLSGDETLDRIEKLGRATPQGTPTETITLEKVLIRPRSPAERPTASRHP